jgi:cell division protein FtsI (penicillin-binding protein 3)
VAAAPAAPAAAPAAAEDDEDDPPAVEAADPRTARLPGGGIAVPSLAGMPARTAIRRLEEADLGAELAGSGRVVGQTPPAGKVVARGTRVRMKLAPAG